MKILITGGGGYIGSILVPALLQENYGVTVIDSFMYGQASLLDACNNKKLNIIRSDARDKTVMERELKNADVVIPLACLTGAPLCAQKPEEAKSVIFDAVKLITSSISQNQMILYPTTNSGYGVGEKDIYCTEESPLRPVSLYGRLKVDAEKAVLESGCGTTFRLATAFGISPRMRLDLLVNDFVYRAVNDRFLVLFEAHFKRNYIHVRDVARAFIHGIKNHNTMKNQTYNVGLSDANLSKWELCEEIKKQLPDFYFIEATIGKDPDQRNYIVSNDKIEKTGYKPQVSLHEGITELIKGYQIIKRTQFSNI